MHKTSKMKKCNNVAKKKMKKGKDLATTAATEQKQLSRL